MQRKAGFFLFWAGALGCLAAPARAQDTQYWTQQYGGSADLLGGMVVGSVVDLSTTFYNPAGLAFYTAPSLVLSAKGYEYAIIRVKGGTGLGANLNSTAFSEGPGLFAGSLTFNPLKGHRFAYSMLTRQDFDLRFDTRGTGQGDVLPEYPGTEQYGGEVVVDQNMTDTWGGLTWAHALGERTGVGVTTYGAYRNQRSRANTLLEALTSGGDVAVAVRTSDISYSNFRFLWKAGFMWQSSPLSLGVTVTTPSVNITGSGWALVNRTTSGIDLDGDGTPDDAVSANYQPDVKAVYKSPLSAAAGAAWTRGNTKIYASLEWFDAIDRYNVLETEPFVSQTEGDTLQNEATNAAISVVNGGVGIEQTLSKSVRLFGAFRTDASSFVPYNGRQVSFSTWDISHLSAGSGFTVGRFALTLGASYSFGHHDVSQPFDLADPQANTFNPVGTRDVNYQRFKVLAGLNVGLD
jgi:hypothetical protein